MMLFCCFILSLICWAFGGVLWVIVSMLLSILCVLCDIYNVLEKSKKDNKKKKNFFIDF